MFTRKTTAVMFGTGAGARRAHACVRHRYDVKAFADNDSRKHGTRFLRRPVISPHDLHRFPSETVLIASMHADQIARQLVLDLRIDPTRVVRVRREILEGAYEVSPRTYVVLGALAALLVAVVAGATYAVTRSLF